MKRTIALRTAVASGIIAMVLTSAGAVLVHVALFNSQLDASRATAAVQADAIQSQTVADVRLGGDYGPLPYELVTSRGVVVSASDVVQSLGPGPVSRVPSRGAEAYVAVEGTETLPSTGTGSLAGVTVVTISDTFPASFVSATDPSDLPGGARTTDTYRVTVFVSPVLADKAVAAIDPFLVAAVPLAALVVAAVAFFAVRRALLPVERMRRAAALVSESPASLSLSAGRRSDELSNLAATLDDMVLRLHEALVAQRRFSADAAHELRSPLAALLTTLEVARAHPAHVDRDQTYAAAIEQGERLRDLTEELLTIASAQSAPTTAIPYDIEATVRRAVSNTGHPRPEVEVVAQIGSSQLQGDPAGLERAVRNLVDNAIRHAASQVNVLGGPVSTGYVLLVSNDGPTIADDHSERIFLPFVRLDDARDRNAGGTGLGLALARDLVEAQGGTLTLDPAADVTTFVISLPVHTA